MTSKIEMGKTYKTRDGRLVRILCVDSGHHEYPVVGVIKHNGCVCQWSSEGMSCYGRVSDLIEVKPRIKGQLWVNVYPNSDLKFIAHPTKASAEAKAGFERVACVPITFDCEEGEGLEK